MKQKEENNLIVAIKAGNREAFSKIYNRYKKMIYRECYIITLNSEEAKDLFQEVWIKIYISIKRIKRIRNLKGFIYSILKSCIIDYLRKRKKIIECREVSENDSITFPSYSNIEHLDLMIILKTLSPFERYLIYLKFYEEKSTKEIGKLLNISENNVRVKLHRIIKKLKQIWEYYG